VTTTGKENVVLAFGSNIGAGKKNIESAMAALEENGVGIVSKSSFYKTSPLGNPDQPDFINAAALAATGLSSRALMKLCKNIEASMGRDSDAPRWSARLIDIEILLYGNHSIDTPDLIVPHPRMGERMFALAPAAEAAPHFIMPGGVMLIDFFNSRLERIDFSKQKVEKLSS
jgi:2-amino-4-hydroxy-6-hydroxymethyldihydropteridine diphosphokinase